MITKQVGEHGVVKCTLQRLLEAVPRLPWRLPLPKEMDLGMSPTF